MSVKLTISIPNWLDRLFVWPVLLYRKYKYGYTFRRIYLGDGEWTRLDVDDYYKYGNFKWNLGGCKKNFYAVCGVKNENGEFKILRLHRLITGAPKGRLVDHKTGDGLDNLSDNLRIATKAQNACNARKRKNTSSRFIGVSLDKRSGRWYAYIGLNYKRKSLGYFDNEADAAKTYDEAAIKYHGEFAKLNFPEA